MCNGKGHLQQHPWTEGGEGGDQGRDGRLTFQPATLGYNLMTSSRVPFIYGLRVCISMVVMCMCVTKDTTRVRDLYVYKLS